VTSLTPLHDVTLNLYFDGVILNGLQAVNDLAWRGRDPVYRTTVTGHPQGSAAARQILHPAEAGFGMTLRLVWVAYHSAYSLMASS